MKYVKFQRGFRKLNLFIKSVLAGFQVKSFPLNTFQGLLECTEAVVRRCFVKKVFLKIPQNSQESTCTRVSFLVNCRPQALALVLYLHGLTYTPFHKQRLFSA